MTPRNLFYNSVTVSLPKNAIQFLLGFVLYWLTFFTFDVTILAISLLGFLLSYSAVYFYNDIMDYDEDMKDKDKRHWKLVASGAISMRTAKVTAVLLTIAGLSLTLYVNFWFFLLNIALLVLNFLHSAPGVRLKRIIPATALNMTAIETIKFSTGWFAFTSNLSEFPFWIILTFSIAYASIYIIYKFRFKGSMIRKNKYVLAPLGGGALLSYALSVVLYRFALPLALLLAFSFGIIVFSLTVGKRFHLMKWFSLEFVIFPTVIAVFLLLSIPVVAHANTHLTDKIDQYKDTVYRELPEDVAETLKNLSEPAYDSLDEVGEAINESMNLSEIMPLP